MEQEVWRPRKEHLFPIVLATGVLSKALVFFKLMKWVSGGINYNFRWRFDH